MNYAMQALDALTPLGRGQALLVAGKQESGKSCMVLDAILGQYGSGVRCIYAAVGQRYMPHWCSQHASAGASSKEG